MQSASFESSLYSPESRHMSVSYSAPLMVRLADVYGKHSFANRLRAARFLRFEKLVSKLPKPVTILDVGGTTDFWEQRGWAGHPGFRITTVNLFPEEQKHENVTSVVGDATKLAFSEGSVDVVFSNSVIEHLRTFENQRLMAAEIKRVGKAFWVQTPNFWFPMEPHFLVPGWQWMPFDVRVAILRKHRCGWMGPSPDKEQARELVSEVRLLRRKELATLFPSATLIPERFHGFVKSWTAISGFPPDA